MWSTKIPTICCMLHLFGSGLGQNGSTRVLWCAVLSIACFANHLRVADAARGKRCNGTQNNECGSYLVLGHHDPPLSFCRLSPAFGAPA